MKRLYHCTAWTEGCGNVELELSSGERVTIWHAIRLQSYDSTACFFDVDTQITYVHRGIWDCSATTHKHMRKFHEWLYFQGYACARPYSAGLVRSSINSGEGAFIEYTNVIYRRH